MSRQILHIDMNSYFATVEQQANPKLRGKPIAVLGSTTKRSIIVAASIEAKKFGVKTAMRIEEAMERCPSLILVNGEPRKYSWVTKQFVRIFEDYTDKVEIFSIDECFLDVTETVGLYQETESSKLSSLAANQGSSRLDKREDCFRLRPKSYAGQVVPRNDKGEKIPGGTPGMTQTWSGAINIANEIKRRIREEIGSYISCSVGISYNKFLAKTGSDLEKPDGLVVIAPENKDEVLLHLPLEEFCGIGRNIRRRLSLLGVNTTLELRNYPSHLLNKEFGIATGEKLKRMSYGFDNSPVISWHDQPPAKSFSCSRTLNRDLIKMDEIKKQILFLFEKVAKNMRDDDYLGQEIGLWLRFKDFTGTGKSMKIGKWTNDGLEMNERSQKILKSMKIMSPIRAIGVYVGRVQLAKNVSKSLLPEDKLNEKILAAMDAVNDRFGIDVVTRASLAKTKLKEVVSGMGRKKF